MTIQTGNMDNRLKNQNDFVVMRCTTKVTYLNFPTNNYNLNKKDKMHKSDKRQNSNINKYRVQCI